MYIKPHADVAQVGERRIRNAEVAVSITAIGSKFSPCRCRPTG